MCANSSMKNSLTDGSARVVPFHGLLIPRISRLWISSCGATSRAYQRCPFRGLLKCGYSCIKTSWVTLFTVANRFTIYVQIKYLLSFIIRWIIYRHSVYQIPKKMQKIKAKHEEKQLTYRPNGETLLPVSQQNSQIIHFCDDSFLEQIIKFLLYFKI
jgi:hypothetical protein